MENKTEERAKNAGARPVFEVASGMVRESECQVFNFFPPDIA